MDLLYRSTRNHEETALASEAILKGLASDGGLFVPDHIPALGCTLTALKEMNYQETAYAVMKEFLTDYTEEELKNCIRNAYDEKFEEDVIVPLAKVDGVYHLELYHGPTIAFKDMALSILPHLMTAAAKKNHLNRELVILTATSGDTGKAALAGFADVPGTRIIVFYPKGGVSRVQELQMVTQQGKNTAVVALHGNFDQAQTGVKALFADQELVQKLHAAGMQFSSANSINIGRLVPQIVYYVYAYGQLLKNEELAEGEAVNVVVPTGNFGNILAAYYAKQMGLPIAKLICASNENKVLFDFFRNGTYDKNREFFLTSSPSMDILVSSNLERLIYLAAGQDDKKTKAFMESLKETGVYSVTEEMQKFLKDFAAGFATQMETAECIQSVYEKTGYVMDTHTAVARSVYEAYKVEQKDAAKTLLASTASPYKFPGSVMRALHAAEGERDEFRLIEKLEEISGMPVPMAVKGLETRPVLHTEECDPETMRQTVEKLLGIA